MNDFTNCLTPQIIPITILSNKNNSVPIIAFERVFVITFFQRCLWKNKFFILFVAAALSGHKKNVAYVSLDTKNIRDYPANPLSIYSVGQLPVLHTLASVLR